MHPATSGCTSHQCVYVLWLYAKHYDIFLHFLFLSFYFCHFCFCLFFIYVLHLCSSFMLFTSLHLCSSFMLFTYALHLCSSLLLFTSLHLCSSLLLFINALFILFCVFFIMFPISVPRLSSVSLQSPPLKMVLPLPSLLLNLRVEKRILGNLHSEPAKHSPEMRL